MGYTKKYQGLGLGLAIAKRCLDLNDVSIEVDSTQGVGTTFTLTFGKVDLKMPEKEIEVNGPASKAMGSVVEVED